MLGFRRQRFDDAHCRAIDFVELLVELSNERVTNDACIGDSFERIDLVLGHVNLLDEKLGC